MGSQIRSTGLLLARAIVIWAVEAISLLLLARLLPGVALSGWRAAVGAAFVLGVLNAVLRPLGLFGALNLGIVAFTLIALALNVAVTLLAARLVPGFTVEGWGNALAVAVGLALLNGLFTGLLSLNDEDSLYRNVTRRLARRRATPGDDRPGTVIVQIDGLAGPGLREELAAGKLPTLRGWLAGGPDRLGGRGGAGPSV